MSDDPVPWRLQLWLRFVFALAERIIYLAASTLAAKRRSLDRQLGAILAEPSRCDLTRDLQAKISGARDQHLVFLAHPGAVAPTNNGSERLLRPAVVQRKMTNGYRAMWAASREADIRTFVDTARLTGSGPFATILNTVGASSLPSRAWVITISSTSMAPSTDAIALEVHRCDLFILLRHVSFICRPFAANCRVLPRLDML